MLLAIDVGNTNVVFALVDGGEIKTRWRIATDPRRTGDEYAVWLHQLLELEGYSKADVTQVIVGTVVPRALHNLDVLSKKYFGVAPLVAGQGDAAWPMALDVPDPSSVGADRALNALAAHAASRATSSSSISAPPRPSIIVDFNGAYKGGVIAPGINLSLDALVSAAAKLPRIAIAAPNGESVIGDHDGKPDADRRLLGLCRDDRRDGRADEARDRAARPRSSRPAGSPPCSTSIPTPSTGSSRTSPFGASRCWRRRSRNDAGREELLFLALGGSGEIGMNVNLYGTEGKWLMADLGLTFADTDYPGIDLILPDLEFIEERRDDLVGIVLTHGHEDHIGALPYLAADLRVPLYATPFTAGLIAGKLEEEGLTGQVKLHVIDRGGSIDLDPFRVTFVPIAHSIPEGNGLLIETPHGNVFHTGDWKIDETPVLGEPTSEENCGRSATRACWRWSAIRTNVFQIAASGSGESVHDGLRGRPSKRARPGAGHYLRIQCRAPGDARQGCDRDRSAGVRCRPQPRPHPARCEGQRILARFPGNGRSSTTAMRLPKREVMIIATGGQGEPRAALGRIACDNHDLKIGEGDTVVFSSKQIPGNEIAIGRIMNALSDLGVIIVTDAPGAHPCVGPPWTPRTRADVPLDASRDRRAGARRGAAYARTGADRARTAAFPRPSIQKNGDIIRLAPEGPEEGRRGEPVAWCWTVMSSCRPMARRSSSVARWRSAA